MQAEHVPPEVVKAGFSPDEAAQFTAFFCRRIFTMTAALRTTRLRVATTACIYFQRFFHKHTWCTHDPRIVAVACIYVAGTHAPFCACGLQEETTMGWRGGHARIIRVTAVWVQ